MSIKDVKVIKDFCQLCDDGWLQGWHERNGGNLTYRLTDAEVAELRPYFDETPRPWVNMGVTGANLAGTYFLSTGSGKYFRNAVTRTEDTICICEINDKGDSYRIVWGLVNGGKPTSEFPSHFMNHSVRYDVTGGSDRVIYHAHPANTIALTFIVPLNDRDMTRVLWKSMTECPVVFPRGIAVVPWMVPGGADIAMASCVKMKEYDAVVWAHHGLFVSGPDFDTAFGLMHTVEKSAEIFIRFKSTGMEQLQTITDDDLRAVANEFNAPLREEFLD